MQKLSKSLLFMLVYGYKQWLFTKNLLFDSTEKVHSIPLPYSTFQKPLLENNLIFESILKRFLLKKAETFDDQKFPLYRLFLFSKTGSYTFVFWCLQPFAVVNACKRLPNFAQYFLPKFKLFHARDIAI